MQPEVREGRRRRRRPSHVRRSRRREHVHERTSITLRRMCRNIRTLYNFDPPATEEEVASRGAAVRAEDQRLHKALTRQRGGLPAGDPTPSPRPRRELLDELRTSAPPKRPRGRGGEGARSGRPAVCRLDRRALGPPSRCGPRRARAQAARYCCQAAGIVGLATWMKTCGLGVPRLLEQAHPDLARQRVALAAVAGRARGDDVLPARGAALGARDHVVDGQVRARAAVLAGPVVAGEHGPAGDLAPVGVARDADVARPAGSPPGARSSCVAE